jgi:BNR repeat-like domain
MAGGGVTLGGAKRRIPSTAILLSCLAGSARADDVNSTTLPIKVVGAQSLPAADIPAARTPLGITNDYKPWIARLANGKLLIVAFCYGAIDGIDGYAERAIFWRSEDGGQTWGPREERLDIQGREFGLTALHDGTLLMTCHWLARDVFNPSKHTHSKIFRSTDAGRTWSEIRIGPDGFPDGAESVADWMAFELPNPERPGAMLTCLGVSMQHGGEQAPQVVRIWRSADSGKTWDKSLHPDTAGWIDVDGFFSQTVTFRTSSGRLLHPVRVDRTGPHWHLPDTADHLVREQGDQDDRMILWESEDDGRTWRRQGGDGRFGYYGEMYPRFLTLQDGRLLLTFTVRSHSTDVYPLGLRAILSGDDGRTWDFEHDRLIVSYVNYGASGGGFGNTIQLDGGTLVSVYSYRDEAGETRVEAVRWHAPDAAAKAAD